MCKCHHVYWRYDKRMDRVIILIYNVHSKDLIRLITHKNIIVINAFILTALR